MTNREIEQAVQAALEKLKPQIQSEVQQRISKSDSASRFVEVRFDAADDRAYAAAVRNDTEELLTEMQLTDAYAAVAQQYESTWRQDGQNYINDWRFRF